MVCIAQQQHTTALCILYTLFPINCENFMSNPAMHIAIWPENEAGYQAKNYYGNSDSKNHFLACFHFERPSNENFHSLNL